MLAAEQSESMKKKTVASLFSLLLLSVGLSADGNPASPQTAVPVGPCKQWVPGTGWAPCSSGSGSAGDGGAAAAAEAARVAREQERLGQVAAGQGAAAYARGDFKSAAISYLAALRYQPNNVEYKKRRAIALAAFAQQLGVDELGELRGAGADAFDATGRAHDLLAIPKVAAPSFSDTLFSNLEIPVNLSLPANSGVKNAMSQVEYMLKSNLDAARSDGAIEPDHDGLEKSVAELNKALDAVLPKGTEPVTVEKVETVFNRYQLNLKVKK